MFQDTCTLLNWASKNGSITFTNENDEKVYKKNLLYAGHEFMIKSY